MKVNSSPSRLSKPLLAPKRVFVALTAAALLAGVPLLTQAQTDDFDDGDDAGWTHYDPRGGLGAGPQANFTFVDGGYHLSTPVNEALNGAGAGRAGALRNDVVYTDFYVSVDIVDFDDTTQQLFGLLARIDNAGLGTTTGYLFSYELGSNPPTETSGDFDLLLLNNEAGDQIEQGESGLHLSNTNDYRFVFIGKGPLLEARVYLLPDIINPILVLTAEDSSHPQGVCGLLTFDNTPNANGITGVTFDNYFATTSEPPRLFFTYIPDFDEVVVSWLTNDNPRLQSTISLVPPIPWTDVNETFIFPSSTDARMLQFNEGPDSAVKAFRLLVD